MFQIYTEKRKRNRGGKPRTFLVEFRSGRIDRQCHAVGMTAEQVVVFVNSSGLARSRVETVPVELL